MNDIAVVLVKREGDGVYRIVMNKFKENITKVAKIVRDEQIRIIVTLNKQDFLEIFPYSEQYVETLAGDFCEFTAGDLHDRRSADFLCSEEIMVINRNKPVCMLRSRQKHDDSNYNVLVDNPKWGK
jgi:hypothetical protein